MFSVPVGLYLVLCSHSYDVPCYHLHYAASAGRFLQRVLRCFHSFSPSFQHANPGQCVYCINVPDSHTAESESRPPKFSRVFFWKKKSAKNSAFHAVSSSSYVESSNIILSRCGIIFSYVTSAESSALDARSFIRTNVFLISTG
jgi:hypothetical protein